MATAESHDVVIRWQQQGQSAVQAEAKKIQTSFSGLGSSLTKSLSGATDSIKKSLASVSAAAKQTGAIMTAGITVPLVAMAKGSIDAASDLNESMSAVKTIFGDASDSVIAFSKTAATSLGITQTQALTAATSFSGFSRQMGLSDQAAADFSAQMVTAAGDLGSFYNADPTDMLARLRSGLSGESEPLKQFGFDLGEAALKAKGLELGLGDASGEMTESEKVTARLALLMEQMGPAAGDAARTIDQFAGSQRVLAAQVQELSADIGTQLLPVAADLVAHLKDLVAWVKNLSPEAQGLAIKIGLVAAAAGPVLIVLGQIGPVLAALASGPLVLAAAAAVALYKAWDENFLGIKDITQTFLTNTGFVVGRMVEFFTHAKERGLDPFELAVRTMVQGLKEVLGDDNPVLDFLRGIKRNGERLADWWKNDGSTTLTTIANLFSEGNFGDAAIYFGHLAEDIKTGWDKTVGAWLADQVGKAGAFAATLFQGIVTGFGQVNWPALKDTLITRGGELIDALRHGAQDVWNNQLGPFVEETTRLGQHVADNVLAGIKAVKWQDVVDEFGFRLKAALVSLDQFSSWVFDAITGAGAESGGGPGGGLPGSDLSGKLGGWLAGQINSIDGSALFDDLSDSMATANIFTDFNQWAQQQGIDLHNKISDWLLDQLGLVSWEDAKTKLSDKGTEIFDGLRHGMQDVWNNPILSWLQGLSANLQSLFNTAGDWLVDGGTAVITGLFGGMQGFWNNTLAPWFTNLSTDLQGVFATAVEWLASSGATIISGLFNGFQSFWNNTLTPWFTHLPEDLKSVFTNAVDWLTQAGRDVIEGLWTGMSERFDTLGADVQQKVDELAPDWSSWLPPTSSDPNAPINSPEGSRGTRDAPVDHTHDIGGMYGRLGSGGWAWVGEAGPELVKLPLGSMVIPHPASMSRALAEGLPHMRYGGTSHPAGYVWDGQLARWISPERAENLARRDREERLTHWQKTESGLGGGLDWGTWLQSLTASSRRHIRDLRAAGALTAENRRAYMAGEIDDFDVRQIGSDQPLNGRAGGTGYGRDKDGRVWDGSLMRWITPERAERHALRDREGRLDLTTPRAYPGGKIYDRGKVWSESLHRWISQQHADNLAARADDTRRAGGVRPSRDDYDAMKEWRGDPSGRGRTWDPVADRWINIYGNVTINPPDADVAGEFSRQFSNRNRV